MKRRIVSALLSTMVAASLLAGCGGDTGAQNPSDSQQGGAEDSQDGAKDSQDETGENQEEGKDSQGSAEKVTMMSWYAEDEMDSIIDAINEQLGGEYEVEYTYITNSDYNNVLSTQLAGGEGPDVVADGANFPARIKAGNVVDITGTGLTDGFSQEGLALSVMDGKNYGVPCYGWFAGIFYNQDLFKQCGINEAPKTFEEFLAACETLSSNGVKPLAMGLADGDNGLHSLCGFLESNYYSTSEEGRSFDTEFAKGEKTMAGNLDSTVQQWMQLVEKGYITPEMVGISGEQAKDEFKTGKAAMVYSGPWDYQGFKDSGINFGVMPFTGAAEDNTYLIGGPAASWGINTKAKNPEGARKVLEALASVEVQQAFIDENPGSSSYREGVSTGLPQEYADVEATLNAGRIACCWDRWSVNMPSQSLIDELNSQIQGLVAGKLTVDGFLGALDSKADSIRYE